MDLEFNRIQAGKRITLIGFWINFVLTVFKILAGIVGRSGAILADGVHSLSDFLTDLVVLLGFKLTERPEDECHNYGHGKYETLATIVISIFLAIVGLEILKSGIENIIAVSRGNLLPQPKMIALIAAAVSIVTKELLYRYTIKVGKTIKSSAVIANAWHHRSDSLSSLGALLGVGGAIVGGNRWIILDPIASVIVSLFIFRVAYQVLKPAVNELMEASLQKEEKERIINILESFQDVKSYHKLRTRRIGAKAAIELHLLVDGQLNVRAAHDIATEIELNLKKELGESCIVTIHIEPEE